MIRAAAKNHAYASGAGGGPAVYEVGAGSVCPNMKAALT